MHIVYISTKLFFVDNAPFAPSIDWGKPRGFIRSFTGGIDGNNLFGGVVGANTVHIVVVVIVVVAVVVVAVVVVVVVVVAARW